MGEKSHNKQKLKKKKKKKNHQCMLVKLMNDKIQTEINKLDIIFQNV